jgi:hypothetical protein
MRRRDGNEWMRDVVAGEGMPDDVAVNSIVGRFFVEEGDSRWAMVVVSMN